MVSIYFFNSLFSLFSICSIYWSEHWGSVNPGQMILDSIFCFCAFFFFFFFVFSSLLLFYHLYHLCCGPVCTSHYFSTKSMLKSILDVRRKKTAGDPAPAEEAAGSFGWASSASFVQSGRRVLGHPAQHMGIKSQQLPQNSGKAACRKSLSGSHSAALHPLL